jgi:hypothetical protein
LDKYGAKSILVGQSSFECNNYDSDRSSVGHTSVWNQAEQQKSSDRHCVFNSMEDRSAITTQRVLAAGNEFNPILASSTNTCYLAPSEKSLQMALIAEPQRTHIPSRQTPWMSLPWNSWSNSTADFGHRQAPPHHAPFLSTASSAETFLRCAPVSAAGLIPIAGPRQAYPLHFALPEALPPLPCPWATPRPPGLCRADHGPPATAGPLPLLGLLLATRQQGPGGMGF